MHHVFRVHGWQGGNAPLRHPLEQLVHVVGSERGLQSAHLIRDATYAPQIALMVIGFVLPDLWAGVVWGTGLSAEQALPRHFTHVKIAQL